MLLNYLKVAIRNLRRNKLISFINLFGLALSMSVGLMVMIRVQDQLNYDNFHPFPARTFRVLTDFKKKTGEHWKMASTALPLADALRKDPAIQEVVNLYPALQGDATMNGKALHINGAFTDPAFFDLFGFPLLTGNAVDLNDPSGIFLSSELAQRYFGNASAIGQSVQFGNGELYTVEGIFDRSIGKSHIPYDAIASASRVSVLERSALLPDKSGDWYAMDASYTYVLAKPSEKTATLNAGLARLASHRNQKEDQVSVHFELQGLRDITPGTEQLAHETAGGSGWTKLLAEMSVAFIMLLAAAFNYTNLTVARSLTRAKEVGVRKINGASRGQVFVQYLVASLLTGMLALGFAWILLSFIIHYAPFNDSYEFIPATFHYNASLFLASFVFALLAGLLAGLAPAAILSAFKPLRVLKNLSTARLFGKISIQKGLIVFQYSLSLFLFIFLLTFYRQFDHLGAANPGFKRDQVLVLPLQGIPENQASQELKSIPGVVATSGLSSLFRPHFDGMQTGASLQRDQPQLQLNYYFTTPDFVKNLNMEIVAGGDLSDSSADSDGNLVLLNQTAVKALGMPDDQHAVGTQLWINDSTQWEVAGVLHDFLYENAGTPVRPLALRSRPEACQFLYVNVLSAENSSIPLQAAAALKKLAPGYSGDPAWLDQQLENNNSQSATISLLGYLAFMAVAIASLGLLGLVMYSVEVKKKEISIRKVIGAGSRQLVKLLSVGFIRLLFIAGLISLPLGYAAGYLFLQNFSSRVGSGFGYALLCFLSLLLMGLCTIFSQTITAARRNPVRALRSE